MHIFIQPVVFEDLDLACEKLWNASFSLASENIAGHVPLPQSALVEELWDLYCMKLISRNMALVKHNQAFKNSLLVAVQCTCVDLFFWSKLYSLEIALSQNSYCFIPKMFHFPNFTLGFQISSHFRYKHHPPANIVSQSCYTKNITHITWHQILPK